MPNSAFIIPIFEINEADLPLTGCKALSLAKLRRIG